MRKDPNQHQDIFLHLLGQVIHDLRTDRGFSQQELADIANVHRTYVSDIERGTRNLTVLTVSRLADALGISVSKVFRLVDDRVDLAYCSESMEI
jgi:transcriptional regulator with XRE-family HTH domain